MKLNKCLFVFFISSCFLSNICLSVNESDPIERIIHKKEEKVAEKKVEKLEKPVQQENITGEILTKPNNSDLSQERTEVKPEQLERQEEVVVEKPKKITKKVQNKKTEDTKSVEQSSSESSVEPNDQSTGVDLSNTDSSSVEFQEFRSKPPQQQDRDSKEYIIRGLVSMLLVVAGAILLVIVIITGVNNKKRR